MSARPGQLVARNALRQLVGQAVPLVAALLSVPWLLAELGPERFGVLTLLFAILGSGSLLDLGTARAVTRLVARALADDQRTHVAPLLGTAALLQLALGSLVALALALGANALTLGLGTPEHLRGDAHGGLVAGALILPVALLAGSLRGAVEAVQRFDIVNRVRVPTQLANQLVPLLVVSLGGGLTEATVGLLVVRLLSLGAWRGAVRSAIGIPQVWALPQRKTVADVLRFGSWASVSALCGPLLGQGERVLVGTLRSAAELAVYAAPLDAMLRLLIVPSAVASALFPACSEPGHRSFDLGRRALQRLVLIGLPAVVCLAPHLEWLLVAWLGPELGGAAARPALPLLLGVALSGLAAIPYTLVQAAGRPEFKARLDLLELPLALGLTYLLTSRYGLLGAAWSRVALAAFDLLALAVLSARAHGQQTRRWLDAAGATVATLTPVLAGLFVIQRLATGPSLGLLAGAAWVAIYAAVLALRHAPELLRSTSPSTEHNP